MDDQMQEPVRIEVDFRQVAADGTVWVSASNMADGAPVEAYDGSGNRCRAMVGALEGGRARLDLVLDSFRTAGE